jgi:hypothetical protein
MIEAMALLAANVDGALVRRTEGVAVVSSGLPFVPFNQVMVGAILQASEMGYPIYERLGFRTVVE